MSETTAPATTTVFPATAPLGKAVHYFRLDVLEDGGHLYVPICERIKPVMFDIDRTEEEVTCKACTSKFRKGVFVLSVPVQEEELIEEEGTDEGDEDEKSYPKAVKFRNFVREYGWEAEVRMIGTMTWVLTGYKGFVIKMAWEDGRYQYPESRIKLDDGATLNAMIRNASAGRKYVEAIRIAEDAERPQLEMVEEVKKAG